MGLQQTLKALADPTRREILNLLKGGKKSAGRYISSCPLIWKQVSVL